MRGAGHADVLSVLQMPGNKLDAVPCKRLPDLRKRGSTPVGRKQAQRKARQPWGLKGNSLRKIMAEGPDGPEVSALWPGKGGRVFYGGRGFGEPCLRAVQTGSIYHKKKGLAKTGETLGFTGAPGRIRTCDLRIRSPALYPAELRALKSWTAT